LEARRWGDLTSPLFITDQTARAKEAVTGADIEEVAPREAATVTILRRFLAHRRRAGILLLLGHLASGWEFHPPLRRPITSQAVTIIATETDGARQGAAEISLLSTTTRHQEVSQEIRGGAGDLEFG
jgi:hypothetical protein